MLEAFDMEGRLMGTVHDLLQERGKRAVLDLDMDRRVVEAAAEYLADEENGLGFAYSGWAQAALPHKRLADDATWQLQTDRMILMVEPGRRPVRDAAPQWVGVPYGSRARLIMLYLQTEALRTGSREVELGGSLRAWLTRMGISPGGKSMKDVKDQAERLSRCRLTFNMSGRGRAGLVNQNIVDSALFLDMEEEGQGSLFLDRARLSESFFAELQKHPVPLEEAAIRAINAHSMALDVYLWLAYRLHVLDKPRAVTWAALKAQFGTGFRQLKHFKGPFQDNLALALAVYPAAKVEVLEEGVVLHPSRPPVAVRQVSVGRVLTGTGASGR
ncbi:replication protein RepA [Roseomonas chloroacetimidivorans]|uniref:replication protein RepA n=1 Tax=Roseomonas chloroacetimidivorans TaxID=1766656 RepID=UPI003C7739EF